MKISNEYLEANVRIFDYSSTEEFSYKAPQSLSISDGNVDFSLLIDIKQTAEIPNKNLEVILMHIFDSEIEDQEDGKKIRSQRFRTVPLGEISLFDLENDSRKGQIIDSNDPLLLSDPWKIKQTIKWNFKDVPSDGPGKYAAALVIYTDEEDEDSEKREFLDCDYFKII